MGWEDRDYYRDRPGGGMPSWLRWVLFGRISLFRLFGIHVQAMAFLIVWVGIKVVLLTLASTMSDSPWRPSPQDIVAQSVLVFAIILLHEFGHCLAARWVGGEANEIVMHPLGGLALAHPPGRPLPTFITVAAGPMVNLIICLITGLYVIMVQRAVSAGMINPLDGPFGPWDGGWMDTIRWAQWIFNVSWMLFVFNMMPIYPLDGGQMLQTILWPMIGYYRSMIFSCTTGMIASAVGVLVAIAFGNVMLGILAVIFVYSNYKLRAQLVAAGPEAVQDMDLGGLMYQPQQGLGGGYGQVGYADENSPRARARAEKRIAAEARQIRKEEAQIEAILEKVSAHGMHSLNWLEKRALRKATERQKQRELEGRGTRRR